MYLFSIFLNSVLSILESWFRKDIFSKDTSITHIEELMEQLSSHFQITAWLKLICSGYYALDGIWKGHCYSVGRLLFQMFFFVKVEFSYFLVECFFMVKQDG